VRLHESIRKHGYARIDIERARARIVAGRTGFDADAVLRAATDLARAFSRTAAAFERTGLEATPRVMALYAMHVDAVTQVLAWANNESAPERPNHEARTENCERCRQRRAVARCIRRHVPVSLCPPWKWPQCPCCGASPDLSLTSDQPRASSCAGDVIHIGEPSFAAVSDAAPTDRRLSLGSRRHTSATCSRFAARAGDISRSAARP